MASAEKREQTEDKDENKRASVSHQVSFGRRGGGGREKRAWMEAVTKRVGERVYSEGSSCSYPQPEGAQGGDQ